ncbi:MAG: hypothetical protein U0V02_09130 [Anaerolineales bacterium]
MHHKHTRPLLALLVLILASLACIPGAERKIGEVSCIDKGYLFGIGTQYQCYCPIDGLAYSSGKLSSHELTGIDPAKLKALACTDLFGQTVDQPSLNEVSATEPPTEEPTAPPTEPPTDPAPLNPYLTGAFTTCDNTARYVNFTIAENAPAYDPATFKLLFNGYEANCAPAANNPKILTCNYPPVSYNPPAGIQVYIGEELVNEFDFNGGKICNPVIPPSNDNNDNNSNDNNSVEPPAPTEPPVDGNSNTSG